MSVFAILQTTNYKLQMLFASILYFIFICTLIFDQPISVYKNFLSYTTNRFSAPSAWWVRATYGFFGIVGLYLYLSDFSCSNLNWSGNSLIQAASNSKNLESFVTKRQAPIGDVAPNKLEKCIAIGERSISEGDTILKEAQLRKTKAIRVASYEWWLARAFDVMWLTFILWLFMQKNPSPAAIVCLEQVRVYQFRPVKIPYFHFNIYDLTDRVPMLRPHERGPKLTLPGYTGPSMFEWIWKRKAVSYTPPTPPYNVLPWLARYSVVSLTTHYLLQNVGSSIIDLAYPGDIPGQLFALQEKEVLNSVITERPLDVKSKPKGGVAILLIVCALAAWAVTAWFRS